MQWIDDILAWYGMHRRVLPWRETPAPYRVWVSEIMLQQTRVSTVCPYFERFIARFPSVKALAEAPLQAVLKAWEGLGYYRRARHLHAAARIVVAQHDGELPRTPDALRQLPGIGEYTAAAIASIAFDYPAAVVDGNVRRVFARYWCLRGSARSNRLRTTLRNRLTEAVIQSGSPAAFNQAIMELGALVCVRGQPACDVCPLSPSCGALARGMVDRLPEKEAVRRVPHYRVAVGLLVHGGRLLIARRSEEQMLGGLWEFPGGKQEPGETLRETVAREMLEEVNVRVDVGEELCVVEHAYSHFRITMTAFHCMPVDGVRSLRCERETRWIRWKERDDFPFPKANHKIFAAVKERGLERLFGDRVGGH